MKAKKIVKLVLEKGDRFGYNSINLPNGTSITLVDGKLWSTRSNQVKSGKSSSMEVLEALYEIKRLELIENIATAQKDDYHPTIIFELEGKLEYYGLLDKNIDENKN